MGQLAFNTELSMGLRPGYFAGVEALSKIDDARRIAQAKTWVTEQVVDRLSIAGRARIYYDVAHLVLGDWQPDVANQISFESLGDLRQIANEVVSVVPNLPALVEELVAEPNSFASLEKVHGGRPKLDHDEFDVWRRKYSPLILSGLDLGTEFALLEVQRRCTFFIERMSTEAPHEYHAMQIESYLADALSASALSVQVRGRVVATARRALIPISER